MHYAKEKKLEENIDAVEDIIRLLQEGKLPFDEAEQQYKNGLTKIDSCLKLLNEGEQKIEAVSEKGYKLHFETVKIE